MTEFHRESKVDLCDQEDILHDRRQPTWPLQIYNRTANFQETTLKPVKIQEQNQNLDGVAVTRY